MLIDLSQYTKEQLAQMWEQERGEAREAAILEDRMRAELADLKRKLTVQADTIEQMNGEAVNKANEIANLKADADALRVKLTDTEAALGRANAQVAQWIGDYDKVRIKAYNHYHRANYAEAHPWRNLWSWARRKARRKG